MPTAKCPECGTMMAAASATALAIKLQEHSKEVHGKELSQEDADKLAQSKA